jgi:hypothetical protein
MKIFKWLSIFGILFGQICAILVQLNIWLQIIIATVCLVNICFWEIYEAYQKAKIEIEKMRDPNGVEFFIGVHRD